MRMQYEPIWDTLITSHNPFKLRRCHTSKLLKTAYIYYSDTYIEVSQSKCHADERIQLIATLPTRWIAHMAKRLYGAPVLCAIVQNEAVQLERSISVYCT